MANYVLTKSEIAKFKAKEAKMTPAQRRAASKAMVEANTAANKLPKKRKG